MSEPFVDLIDLASQRLGGAAVAANDEFFASKDRLVIADPPIWREGEYTDRGKWMDGWESRRRRDVLPGEPGFDQVHDWCIVRLGARGIIRGVDVETTHFKGNFPESCALETCVMPGALKTLTVDDLDRAVWHGALERSALRGDSHNLFDVAGADATHVRLNIFPDGGVARLRVYGDVVPDWDALRRTREIDLASVLHGGRVVGCSDMFFGSRNSLIMPGEARTIAEGWETKRRRTPGHDWTVIQLGATGTIVRVEVDTRRFKGNAPAACSLEACARQSPTTWDEAAAIDWRPLLPRTALTPDRRHTFHVTPDTAGITHVRFNIFPDGGVSRLRLFGRFL
jgi:allantoicase